MKDWVRLLAVAVENDRRRRESFPERQLDLVAADCDARQTMIPKNTQDRRVEVRLQCITDRVLDVALPTFQIT